MNTIIYFFASIILTAFANDDNNKFECGIANKETIKARIIGGTEVSNNKYPWMVAVLKKSQSNDWRCGGSLISENAIITAAHCVYDTKAEDIEVLIGTNDIDSTDTDNRKNVKQVIPHFGFELHSYACDIAVLILADNITFSETVRPICLPPKNMIKSNEFVVAGWGLTENDTKSQFLRDVTVTRLPLGKCIKGWLEKGYAVSKCNICAGDVGKDTCRGDSGGPLMQVIDEKYYLAGITSFGERNCGSGRDSVYTRTRCFNDWIKLMITPVKLNIDYDYDYEN